MAEEYGVRLTAREDLRPADAVIVAVPHSAFREGGWPLVTSLLKVGGGLGSDIRACLDRDGTPDSVTLWRL